MRKPRALIKRKNKPTLGSITLFSILEIYDFVVPTR